MDAFAPLDVSRRWLCPWANNPIGYSAGLDDSAGDKYRPINGWDINLNDGWFYQEMTVPTGTTYVSAYIYALGTGFSMQLGQLSLVNLTQNGLLNL